MNKICAKAKVAQVGRKPDARVQKPTKAHHTLSGGIPSAMVFCYNAECYCTNP